MKVKAKALPFVVLIKCDDFHDFCRDKTLVTETLLFLGTNILLLPFVELVQDKLSIGRSIESKEKTEDVL